MAQLGDAICSNCQALNAATSAFCSTCGSKINTESNLPSAIDKLTGEDVDIQLSQKQMLQWFGGAVLLFVVGWFIIWVANGGLYKDNTQTPSSIERKSVKPGDNSLASTPTPPPKAAGVPGLTEEQANEVAKPSTPVEYQLAVMNAGRLVPKDDPSVKEFRRLLIELQKRTGYSFADIRQKNIAAVKMAREKTGKAIELLNFMNVSLTLVKRFPDMGYNEVLAGMVVNSELWP